MISRISSIVSPDFSRLKVVAANPTTQALVLGFVRQVWDRATAPRPVTIDRACDNAPTANYRIGPFVSAFNVFRRVYG
jgi:hypothetical protein